ncbi:MAG: sugar isomerase domain-containing protein [Armatimonadetes bacterium]|nr:sugar isomerase domain-containing protein [Armatimonadota bacterium]
MSQIQNYFTSLQSLISTIGEAEAETIARVSALGAQSVAKQGVLHIFDTGHMLTSELIGRAGGLLAWTPLSISLSVTNPNRFREKEPLPPADDLTQFVKLGLGRSRLRAQDLLFVGSVSGKTPMPVEIALQARALGTTVVALTSVEHSRRLDSEHASGKRLFEVADLVLDNHAPPGDAMLSVDGFDRRLCPASGLAAACAMWAVNAGIVSELVGMGIEPSVYSSVNLPGGPENVKAIEERYTKLGY